MDFYDWRSKLEGLNMSVSACLKDYQKAVDNKNEFLRTTLGFAPGDMATVEGTADLAAKVFEMKMGEKSEERQDG